MDLLPCGRRGRRGHGSRATPNEEDRGMGGPGSGNHYNHGWRGTKATVEDCLSIDANRWTREGSLKAGVRSCGSWHWTWTSGRTSSISYEARAEDMASPCVRLSYSSK